MIRRMGPLQFPAWDPVLLDLPLAIPIDLRWYGLMYIVGFVAGQWILTRLARARFLPVAPERVTDLVFYCILGTILGGRLGYAIFYQQGLFDPMRIIRVWEGGLAFHGGLIGVITAVVIFSVRSKVPIGRVLDAAALAVTPGILAVRIANFINGELYGRRTTADTPFAMRFPTDEAAAPHLGLDVLRRLGGGKRAEELMIQYAYRKVDFDQVLDELPAASHGSPELEALRQVRWEDVREAVPFRHPSQLYEALGEGIVLGLVLLATYLLTRRRPLAPWTYGGIFVFGYGVVRFAIEYFRQPDPQFRDAADQLGTVAFGLTMGQLLCAAMVVVGGFLIVRGALLGRPEPGDSGGSDAAPSADDAAKA